MSASASPSDDERISELLWAALQQPADSRAKWLGEQPLDEAQRAEVADLLAHHAAAGTRFDHPPVARPTEAGQRLLELADGELPERIGTYRVVRLLGSGGMGTVYEAEQEHPRRSVALKVMAGGLGSPSARRRFSFEAEALARLRHPGIAQVYEAVAPEEGSQQAPWFAMEYVPGALPITEYATRHALDLRARLTLFTRICDAVHHGHQRGVIHRDLKPDNILVTDEGQPKVIDFGVARLTEPDKDSRGQTLVGQLVGTLGSMAPEQILGDPDEIDTRADVYALGSVLYELLTGRPPYDVEGLSVPQASHLVTSTEPSRPSRLDRHLRGDPEVIVTTAMADDRERRYNSAAHLAADIRRFLEGLPISARPASLGYQLARFAARNRLAVTVAVVALLALAASSVVSLGLARNASAEASAAEAARLREARARGAAEQARHVAEQASREALAARDAQAAQRQLAEQARTEAESARDQEHLLREQARAARLVAEQARTAAQSDNARLEATLKYLLEDVFAAPYRRDESAGSAMTIPQALDRAAAGLDQVRDPWVASEVRTFFGQMYLNLGHPAEAAEQLAAARDLRDELARDTPAGAGVAPERRVYTLQGLAEAEQLLGQYDRARADYETVLAWGEQQGLDHTPSYADALAGYATLLRDLDDGKGAMAALRRAETIFAAAPDADPLDLGRVRLSMATLLRLTGRFRQALEILNPELQAALQRTPVNQPFVAELATEMGSCHTHLGDFSQAEELLNQALQIKRRVLEEGHPGIASGLVALAVARHAMGQVEDAAVLLREAADIYRSRLGPTQAYLPTTLVSLGATLISAGHPEQALEPLHEALAIYEQARAETHMDCINGRSHLGEALLRLGRLDEAAEQLHAAQAALEARTSPIDPAIERTLAERLARLAARS